MKRKLDRLTFTVWDRRKQEGHALWVGNYTEISQFLETHPVEHLQVSALDLDQMHSLHPIPADHWLDWYYGTVLSRLEEQDFDDGLLVPYPPGNYN